MGAESIYMDIDVRNAEHRGPAGDHTLVGPFLLRGDGSPLPLTH
jgi:hypothetical protein